MKKLLVACMATAAWSGTPALAADIPTKAPAHVVSAASNWTGCYIGGNLGGGWASTNWANPGGAAPGDRGTARFNGIVGGGQVGCNYQFSTPWVIGIQGMFDWSGMKGGVANTNNSATDLATDVRWFATLTGRLGYAVQPNALLYVKGGAAWVRDNHTVNWPGILFETGHLTRSGWIAGGGIELMFASNWSAFVEYDYMGFGTKTTSLSVLQGGPPATQSWDIRQNVQTILLGLNYRFYGRAVVANY
jgi:outer membrane immunogenic protein